ncbi:MAG: methyl-accepting chemotaxis protein [Thermodesulfobacteriota bacterium]|nr:methyl-accepting chemotaxis protein [Thermodesulfobacteriota bacterium]
MNIMKSLWKKSSLRTKFLVLTIMVMGLFSGYSLYQNLMFNKKTAMAQAAESSDRLLESTYSAMKFPMSVADEVTVEEMLKGIDEHMKGVEVFISDFKANVIYASIESNKDRNMEEFLFEKKSRQALAKALATGRRPDASYRDNNGDDPFLVTILPILNEASCYHCHGSTKKVLGAMVIKHSVKDVLISIRDTGRRLITQNIIMLIGLIIFINFLFSRLVSRRIQILTNKTDQVIAGDVDVEVSDHGYEDSIGRLNSNFNEMIQSIRDRMEYAVSLKLGISEPFFTVDTEMRVTFINDAACRLCGRSRDECLGMFCYDLFQSKGCVDCSLKIALSEGKSTIGKRTMIRDAQGREIPVMSSYAALKDSRGNVLGAFEIIRDLTAEVRSEKMLKDAYVKEEEANTVMQEQARELSAVLERVSQGDFTRRASASGKNDIMDLLTDGLNETLDKVVSLISNVKKNTVPVTKGVMQISNANQNLSERTQQQAAAMEEISSTILELVQNTSENLETTRHADSMSKEAVSTARDGGDMVRKTAQAMVEMSDASQKIVEMMELINEITFQTNLLSINAAVEAARAGEQGRGFAVVANEVRSLSKRSSASAKNIQTLVKEIMGTVTKAGKWVDELQDSFERIMTTSGEVSRALGEVSVKSDESATGIDHINKGTQEICEVNEKNASFVDEIAQETQKLRANTEYLQEITEVFILGDQDVFHENTAKMENFNLPEQTDYQFKKMLSSPRKDLIGKTPVIDLEDDLLKNEFEEGFEEF